MAEKLEFESVDVMALRVGDVVALQAAILGTDVDIFQPPRRQVWVRLKDRPEELRVPSGVILGRVVDQIRIGDRVLTETGDTGTVKAVFSSWAWVLVRDDIATYAIKNLEKVR